MTETADEQPWDPDLGIDVSVAHPARVYAVPPGSYLVISHPALDIGEGQAAAQRAYNQNVATAQTLRTRDEFARFFTGLELVEPGLVQVHQWHPDPDDSAPEGTVSAHGGVARKAG
jgi:S-adenosyl methyltransferase